MGLALHAKAGKLLEKEQYKEALEVLELAEVRTAQSHIKVWSLADALEGITSCDTWLGRCCDLKQTCSSTRLNLESLCVCEHHAWMKSNIDVRFQTLGRSPYV